MMDRDDVKAAGQIIAAMTAAGFDRDEIGRTVAACFPHFTSLRYRLALAIAARYGRYPMPQARVDELRDFISGLMDKQASAAVIAEAVRVFLPHIVLTDIPCAWRSIEPGDDRPRPLMTDIMTAWMAG